MARVIRGARVVPATTALALDEASRIRHDAREEAAELLRDARREAAGIAATARATGTQDALHHARAELAASLAALEHERTARLEAAREEITSLAIAIARRAFELELAERPAHVARLVDEALARVRRAGTLRVRVHPSSVPHLAQLDVTLIEDATLAPGDCVVESDLGVVDARLETRLDALARALKGSGR